KTNGVQEALSEERPGGRLWEAPKSHRVARDAAGSKAVATELDQRMGCHVLAQGLGSPIAAPYALPPPRIEAAEGRKECIAAHISAEALDIALTGQAHERRRQNPQAASSCRHIKRVPIPCGMSRRASTSPSPLRLLHAAQSNSGPSSFARLPQV